MNFPVRIPGWRCLWCLYLAFMPALSVCTAQRIKQQEQPMYHFQWAFGQQPDTLEIRRMIVRGKRLIEQSPDSAGRLYYTAWQQSQQAGYNFGLAHSLLGLGIIESRQGSLKKAISLLYQAIPYSEQAAPTATPSIYNIIGNIYSQSGRQDLGALHYYKALDATKNNNGKQLVVIYSNLANLYAELDQDSEMPMYYIKRIQKALSNQLHDSSLAVIYYYNMGNLFFNRENWAEAYNYYDTAYKFVISNAHSRDPVYNLGTTILDLLGHTSIKKGNPETGVPYLQTALALANKLKDNFYSGKTYQLLGEAYYQMGKYSLAEKTLDTGLGIIKAAALPEYAEIDFHRVLSSTYAATGKYQKAYEHYRIYTHIQDSVNKKDKLNIINQYKTRKQIAAKDREIDRKQIELLKKDNQLKVKDLWIGAVSAGALLLGGLLLSLYRHSKNKERMLLQEQEIGRLHAIVQGEEKERSRLGRELHDGIGGMLASVRLNLGVVKQEYHTTDPVQKLEHIMDMLRDMATEIRKTAHNLMPDVLTRHSLGKALTMYCEDINQSGILNIELQLQGNPEPLDKGTELMLYRIIQELIQNIIKHAQATQTFVHIWQHDKKLSITVEDNGEGFDAATDSNGYGMQNLDFRIRALQGTVSFVSARGKGTTVYIDFELEKLRNIHL